ncbi:MAG: sugar ABC transporter permease [Chloroflexi bacterium]|nr:sugar ABC transporter permease [Chloroflexota bacterium]
MMAIKVGLARASASLQAYRQLPPVRRKRRLHTIALGYALMAPAVILLLVFEFYPLFSGLWISLTNWRLTRGDFIGLANYTRAFSDPGMWHSLGITFTYSLISVPLQLVLALLLAYLLFQQIKGTQFFRVLYFMPYVTSTVASAAVWAYIFSPDIGLLNRLLEGIGLSGQRWLGESRGILELAFGSLGVQLPGWLAGPSLAMVSLIIYTTWVFVGYDAVLFLSGLSNIPNELYDAAKVDGASGWQLFRYITFPLLSPTTFFVVLITVIGTFKAFNHIYIMTKGGPGDATTTASIYIFNQMVVYNRYGYSAALSFIMFFVILGLTIVQNNVAGKRVVYD